MDSNTDLSEYVDQKVVVQYKPKEGTDLVEATGVCMAFMQAGGILFKPKGRQNAGIIEMENLESIKFAPAENKKLKPVNLKPIGFGAARQHMIERHGYKIADIEPWTEEQALDWHTAEDHGGLGHNHDPKPVKEKAVEAPEAAEAAAPDAAETPVDPEVEYPTPATEATVA